jgi:hypothetical protein
MEQHTTTGAGVSSDGENLDVLEARYGSRFLRHEAPAEKLPSMGMPALDAMRLVGEELIIDGSPMRNLATFVTTWMEPEALRLIADNLHRNFIDHAEHPDACRSVPCSGRDDGREDAGLIGGDHARRAVVEVELAQAPRSRRQVN